MNQFFIVLVCFTFVVLPSKADEPQDLKDYLQSEMLAIQSAVTTSPVASESNLELNRFSIEISPSVKFSLTPALSLSVSPQLELGFSHKNNDD
jgi:hypothetical protein